MPMTPKQWMDFPNKTTPRDADAQKAAEIRVASYAAVESIAPGAASYEDFRVKQRGAGANFSVDVGLAGTLMSAWIRSTGGGVYRYEYNGTQLNAAIGNPGAQPRVDRVCLTAPASVETVVPQVVVLPGTPTAGTDLNTLNGAQAIPAGYLLLADVYIAPGDPNIVNTFIRDRRQNGDAPEVAPFSVTAVTGQVTRDEVLIIPSNALPLASQTITPAVFNGFQSAYLGRIPRKILGATRIRFKYGQGTTPATSTFMFAICDASGRPIASGTAAWAGAASTLNEAAVVIAATNFEPGPVFVLFGCGTLTASSVIGFFGTQGSATVTTPGPGQRNRQFSIASGGVTVPNNLAGFTDVASVVTASYTCLPAPVVSLSVG